MIKQQDFKKRYFSS